MYLEVQMGFLVNEQKESERTTGDRYMFKNGLVLIPLSYLSAGRYSLALGSAGAWSILVIALLIVCSWL